MYLGSWNIDDYLTFVCNTHDPSDGSASDADSVPSYRIYEDETSTPIVTGSMALLDSSNTDGFYSEQVQLTSASGFEVGKCYTIYISAAVNSITGTMSHMFQILAEANVAAVSDDATAADDLELLVENAKGTDHKVLISADSQDLSASLDVNTKTLTAGIITSGAFGNDAITSDVIGTAAIGSDQLATSAAEEIADAVWDEDVVAAHNTADTAGAFMDDIDDILTDTAEIGAAGAGLTAVPWNSNWDAEVESEVIDALQTMLSDSVPADGTRPTFEQALYMITQFLLERVVTGTAVSVKKVDGSTELFSLTMNSATDPTSITRSS